jgi:Zinc-binding dehydrogenase
MIPERTGLFEKKLRTTAISPSSGRCPNDTALWPRSRARVGSGVRAELDDDGLGERRRILPWPVTASLTRRHVGLIRGVRIGQGEMLELARTALAEAAPGRLRPLIGQTFPLERAAQAHVAIESRATVGKTLLVLKGI